MLKDLRNLPIRKVVDNLLDKFNPKDYMQDDLID